MPTEVEIRAPAEQTEGTRSQVLRWLKSVGENVTENEPLLEIETDKVTVEVASPGSGTLSEILKQEQDEIAPGDLLGRIEGLGTQASAGAATHTASDGGDAAPASSDAPVSSHAPGSLHPPASPDPSASPRASPLPSALGSMARALSPAVRRLLAEHGLDSTSVRGTGESGRITVEDVLRYADAGGSSVSAASGGTSASSPRATTSGSAAAASTAAAITTKPPQLHPTSSEVSGGSQLVPHTPVRKRIAEHMVQSLQTAPHVTTVFEADMSAVLEHRRRNKDEFARRGAPLTLTAYFLQAAVAAIRAVPEANSRWTDNALEIFDSVHIGVATALETGLLVPVLRDVQSRDLFETARGLEDLVSRAREGRLSPADVRGGTFTISNHGVSGSLVATPIIINQPQSAILGVGKLEKRAVVITEGDADRVGIQPRCYVTLTIDHRVMDGHQANRFLRAFVEWLATSSA
jgi:2-oxoglutarate dehydrogenase E2 component (dihydrolipoamide succinyltransferase)